MYLYFNIYFMYTSKDYDSTTQSILSWLSPLLRERKQTKGKVYQFLQIKINQINSYLYIIRTSWLSWLKQKPKNFIIFIFWSHNYVKFSVSWFK